MLDSVYHRTSKLLNNLIFWPVNVKISPSFAQRYNGCHYVMLLNLFINFIAWCYITPRRDTCD